jgi:hypothetical protein
MRVLKFDRTLRQEIDTILHLPLWQRVFHRKTRKPLLGISVSILIMFMGSMTAKEGHAIAHWIGGSAIMYDVLGYLMHGIGSVPFVKFAEPTWAVLIGTAETVAEAA